MAAAEQTVEEEGIDVGWLSVIGWVGSFVILATVLMLQVLFYNFDEYEQSIKRVAVDVLVKDDSERLKEYVVTRPADPAKKQEAAYSIPISDAMEQVRKDYEAKQAGAAGK